MVSSLFLSLSLPLKALEFLVPDSESKHAFFQLCSPHLTTPALPCQAALPCWPKITLENDTHL